MTANYQSVVTKDMSQSYLPLPPSTAVELYTEFPLQSSTHIHEQRLPTNMNTALRQPSVPSVPPIDYTTTPDQYAAPYRFPAEQIDIEWPPMDDAHRAANIRRATGHPYARLYAKKGITKRHRKIWNHALEKSLFDSNELATMGAPNRRSIYVASLEAHVDSLHAQLLTLGLYPVPFEKLERYRGLNSKTAKSMVAGLQHDNSLTRMKLLELERSNDGLREIQRESQGQQFRRHSVDVPSATTLYR